MKTNKKHGVMRKSIEVSEATALMIEALQKKYEAVCLATDAIDVFFGLSESSHLEMKKRGWSENEIETHDGICRTDAEEWSEKIYKSVWGFEDELWKLFCIMAKETALSEVKEGKIFTSI